MHSNFKRNLIYVRYWFPLIALCLMLLLLLLPCYRYTTADTGMLDAVSLADLLGNSWTQVTSVLFAGTGSQDAANLYFAKVVLALEMTFFVLFAVSLASAVYTVYGALCFFRNPDDRAMRRVLFLTLMPNRAVGLLCLLLALPLFAFPHILTNLYIRILDQYVTLTLTFPDPLILAVVLYAVAIILSVLTASSESALGMNPFAHRHAAEEDEEDAE